VKASAPFIGAAWASSRVLALAAAGVLGCAGASNESFPRTAAADLGVAPPRPALPAAPAAPAPAIGLPAVRGLFITVSDLDASLALFRGLDFELVDERYLAGSVLEAFVGIPRAELRLAHLRLGAETVLLGEFVAPKGRRIPQEVRANDAIFQHMAIVVRDMDLAFERVRMLPGVRLVSPVPQTIPRDNPAAGGIRALYFEDADGHDLELIWFPPEKGSPRWHSRRTGVFLGIDHSAIAVADTSRSEPLYRAIGFHVRGHSLNAGREQAALSGVPGARVMITGLLAEGGPGVEFLRYLEPGPGALAPADASANDVWHWEVLLEVPDVDAASRAIEAEGGATSAPVDIRSLDLGYRRALLARDRDGHGMRLLER
jgi:catechol 2,3-dioxygenase-like lactoylglutathione lyase family enzyme